MTGILKDCKDIYSRALDGMYMKGLFSRVGNLKVIQYNSIHENGGVIS